MPAIIETKVFTISELSDSAKERARQWYRDGALDYDWYDSVYGDFEQICETLGITLDTKSVPLMNGKTRQKPCIWFSGFCSQGDGACFEGRYAYKKGAHNAIRAYAPQDARLHAIADALLLEQKRCFYQLTAQFKQSGRYYHEHSMDIDVDRESPTEPTAESVDGVKEALRDLARWLYRTLEAEHDYLLSDETVDDNIQANEYTFTEHGNRFG